tara:strand:+ start:540 stop:1079 length:540 start_codon:yes stop_codon:yes gene_type:complete
MKYPNLKIKFLSEKIFLINKIFLCISIFPNLFPISQIHLISSGILLSTSSLAVLSTQRAQADTHATKFAVRCFNKFNARNYREAINDCSEFIKRDRNSIAITRIYEYRAMSKSKIGDYYGAISDFGEVIKREPNDAEIYIMRALLKINQVNQIKSGCKDLKKAVALGYPANKGVKKYCN